MLEDANRMFEKAMDALRGDDDPGPDAPADEMVKEGRRRSQGVVETDLDEMEDIEGFEDLGIDIESDLDDLEDF